MGEECYDEGIDGGPWKGWWLTALESSEHRHQRMHIPEQSRRLRKLSAWRMALYEEHHDTGDAAIHRHKLRKSEEVEATCASNQLEKETNNLLIREEAIAFDT
jgi:hypothetical protein